MKTLICYSILILSIFAVSFKLGQESAKEVEETLLKDLYDSYDYSSELETQLEEAESQIEYLSIELKIQKDILISRTALYERFINILTE